MYSLTIVAPTSTSISDHTVMSFLHQSRLHKVNWPTLCPSHQYNLIMTFSRFNRKSFFTVASNDPLLLVITNVAVRFLQFNITVAVLANCSTELNDARKTI